MYIYLIEVLPSLYRETAQDFAALAKSYEKCSYVDIFVIAFDETEFTQPCNYVVKIGISRSFHVPFTLISFTTWHFSSFLT